MIKKPEKGPWYFEIENPSFNFRITDIQCALGLSQLKKIKKFVDKRKEISEIYKKSFKNIEEIIVPEEENYAKSSWHIYPIQVNPEKRMKIFESLQKMGIKVHVHYMPLHLHPFYMKQFGYKKGDFKNAEEYYNSAITIPLFPKMNKREINYVVSAVKRAVSENR
jgi:dTDP-4-amino-4,6-dideoxygalactose transaminase